MAQERTTDRNVGPNDNAAVESQHEMGANGIVRDGVSKVLSGLAAEASTDAQHAFAENNWTSGHEHAQRAELYLRAASETAWLYDSIDKVFREIGVEPPPADFLTTLVRDRGEVILLETDEQKEDAEKDRVSQGIIERALGASTMREIVQHSVDKSRERTTETKQVPASLEPTIPAIPESSSATLVLDEMEARVVQHLISGEKTAEEMPDVENLDRVLTNMRNKLSAVNASYVILSPADGRTETGLTPSSPEPEIEPESESELEEEQESAEPEILEPESAVTIESKSARERKSTYGIIIAPDKTTVSLPRKQADLFLLFLKGPLTSDQIPGNERAINKLIHALDDNLRKQESTYQLGARNTDTRSRVKGIKGTFGLTHSSNPNEFVKIEEDPEADLAAEETVATEPDESPASLDAQGEVEPTPVTAHAAAIESATKFLTDIVQRAVDRVGAAAEQKRERKKKEEVETETVPFPDGSEEVLRADWAKVLRVMLSSGASTNATLTPKITGRPYSGDDAQQVSLIIERIDRYFSRTDFNYRVKKEPSRSATNRPIVIYGLSYVSDPDKFIEAWIPASPQKEETSIDDVDNSLLPAEVPSPIVPPEPVKPTEPSAPPTVVHVLPISHPAPLPERQGALIERQELTSRQILILTATFDQMYNGLGFRNDSVAEIIRASFANRLTTNATENMRMIQGGLRQDYNKALAEIKAKFQFAFSNPDEAPRSVTEFLDNLRKTPRFANIDWATFQIVLGRYPGYKGS